MRGDVIRRNLIAMHRRLRREQDRIAKMFPKTEPGAALPCDELVRNMDTAVAQIELSFQYTDTTLAKWSTGQRP